MQRDLSVLVTLIGALAVVAPRFARAFNIRDGFAEFRRYTLQELDFEIEAAKSVLAALATIWRYELARSARSGNIRT
jgi:predicted unusual protein kinase regulating ubiquinone biosynthesis (AarF/ABC1/UbiB family)